MSDTIRFATKEDVESVMHFIDTYWRKGHILSRDRRLFEWQYGGASEGLNIVLGVDDAGNIQGMLGFIPYDDSEDKDIALALWKANPSTGFLGIRMLKYLMDQVPHREIVCPGINIKTTSKLYEYVGMQVGTMAHWYRLASKESYAIAKIVDAKIPVYKRVDHKVTLIPMISEEQLCSVFERGLGHYLSHVPYKSLEYVLKRYYRHPTYQYEIFGVQQADEGVISLLVFRIQECNGSRALRFIDCIGEQECIADVTDSIDALMDEFSCEYVDVYVAGVSDGVFLSGGWRKAEPDGNIIPDYFAPFEQRPVTIHYATSNASAVLFKGDGDQDRPS